MLADRITAVAVLVLACAFMAGCEKTSAPYQPTAIELEQAEGAEAYRKYGNPAAVVFADQVESNRDADEGLAGLEFIDTDANIVKLADYQGKKNLVLVFTRGFAGFLCPFCTTQTSRLIANYDQFVERDAEVLLVYPGKTEHIGEFIAASKQTESEGDGFPFPVLLDEDLSAVKRLDIASQLAFPSTFIIDKQGNVTLAYVGTAPNDRPSIKAMLSQLDQLKD